MGEQPFHQTPPVVELLWGVSPRPTPKGKQGQDPRVQSLPTGAGKGSAGARGALPDCLGHSASPHGGLALPNSEDYGIERGPLPPLQIICEKVDFHYGGRGVQGEGQRRLPPAPAGSAVQRQRSPGTAYVPLWVMQETQNSERGSNQPANSWSLRVGGKKHPTVTASKLPRPAMLNFCPESWWADHFGAAPPATALTEGLDDLHGPLHLPIPCMGGGIQRDPSHGPT